MSEPKQNEAPKSFRLAGAGLELQVYDYGNEGAPNLVLLHGMQDLALGMTPLANAFRERYRVVSFDLRGHGSSLLGGKLDGFVGHGRVELGRNELL